MSLIYHRNFSRNLSNVFELGEMGRGEGGTEGSRGKVLARGDVGWKGKVVIV